MAINHYESQFEQSNSPYPAFHHVVEALTDYAKQRIDPDTGLAMTIEQIDVEMPIEISISVDEQGQVHLAGSPPTQRTETTFLPVFHNMKLTVVQDHAD